jgi:hypothetical protein
VKRPAYDDERGMMRLQNAACGAMPAAVAVSTFPDISASDSIDLAGCTRLRLQPHLDHLVFDFFRLGQVT